VASLPTDSVKQPHRDKAGGSGNQGKDIYKL
jgi:hypothetical protein